MKSRLSRINCNLIRIKLQQKFFHKNKNINNYRFHFIRHLYNKKINFSCKVFYFKKRCFHRSTVALYIAMCFAYIYGKKSKVSLSHLLFFMCFPLYLTNNFFLFIFYSSLSSFLINISIFFSLRLT